ncbi:MAG: carbohydrate kinase [Chloroflexota bacterium]|nr:carbohydrate kinase [Chloroflexota bacterium]
MPRTLLYGLILFDIIEGKKYVGGPAINIALHMANHGYLPTLVSCIGNDELGSIANSVLVENHVSIDFVNTDFEHETGWVKVFLDNQGNPKFEIIQQVAYDFISLSDTQMSKLSQNPFDIIYFGTVVQRNSKSQETLRHLIKKIPAKEIFFDINLRPGHYSKEVVDFSLNHTDILKLNEEELLQVADLFEIDTKSEASLIDWIFSKYPSKIILLTRGKNGATVFTHNIREDIKGLSVKVKDTVGSGDAFSAGFIMEYLSSGDVTLAAQKGNKLGAYVATKSGAVPELDENKQE